MKSLSAAVRNARAVASAVPLAPREVPPTTRLQIDAGCLANPASMCGPRPIIAPQPDKRCTSTTALAASVYGSTDATISPARP